FESSIRTGYFGQMVPTIRRADQSHPMQSRVCCVTRVQRQAGSSYGPGRSLPQAIVGIVICGSGLMSVLLAGPHWRDLRVVIALLLGIWVIHVVLLRPRVYLTPELLTIRGSLRDVEIPISLIERVLIGGYTRVVTTQGIFATPVIARPRRISRSPGGQDGLSEADLFEQELMTLIRNATPNPGASRTVRRSGAALESAILVLLLALLGVSFSFS
ncbi:MAG TPA: hypothetical protein PLC19_05185, partial [Marmoricola sp.]|nr:hypothetical protein [Marmoricola sp.]